MEKFGLGLIGVLLINLLFIVNFCAADEILGCGGFIKSHADIDFSKVEVKLLTKQGSLKDKTECSPSNGYYFLPVYDKGEYTLKISPPPGWSFEPEQIDISFDGKTDLCSLGKDVNFAFKGFGITGQVVISTKNVGVSGVNVELKSENNQDIRATLSDASGIFYFTPVIPGRYSIKVSRNTWHFEQAEHIVDVTSGNTELPKDTFVVSGFDVSGKIQNDGQSLGNIGFALFSQKNQILAATPKCDQTGIPKDVNGKAGFEENCICFSQANQRGNYLFSGIAPGKYLIKPHILNKNLQLHIQPEFIEIEIAKDSLVVADQFEVTGFSVSGRVLGASPNGWGIANAKVKLNGQVITTTHTDGSYQLKNIKAGTYTIQVVADKVQFVDHTVKVALANPTLPDIVVSAYEVCGQVVSQQSYTVAITKHSSTFHIQATSKAETGEWCAFLPTGRFTAEVLTSSEDRSLGIQFFPLQQNIEVTSSPVSGITFSQLRATITGTVRCLPDAGHVCNDITVNLYALDSNGKQSGQYVSAPLQGGKYSFTEVLPGTYEVVVPSPTLCWHLTTVTLIVKSATETVPEFVHTGYLLSILSSHTTTMNYKLNAPNQSEAGTDIPLSAGLNSFCVQRFGQYNIKFIGCHSYDSQDTADYIHTLDQTPLIVNAAKHRNGIRIVSDVQASYKFILEKKDKMETIHLVAEPNKVDGHFVYRHDLQLRGDERIVVTPVNDDMLFKPQNQEVIGGNDCVDNAFSFVATKGLIINGKIVPPIAEATVTISFPKNPSLVAIETKSNDKGQFKFGPLDGAVEYEVTAFKESYVFSDYDKAAETFKAHKLCEIIATVRDEEGNQLSGVLLSLSGAESYRKNLVTGDDGTIKFHSLSPSQYFLRPMMKEYKFEPNSKIIDVKDGETVNVILNGKRVAYSVFGSVTSLNGEPFPNVIVESHAIEPCQQHQEESTTENNGNYRIRGLQPGCSYSIKIKPEGDNAGLVDRTIPPQQIVEIEQNDFKDVNIIAISPISFVDVIARIQASSNEHYKTLRIQLYKKGSSESPIYSQRVESPLNVKGRTNPGIMVFFPRIPYDGKTYVIELSTSLSERNYKYNLPIETFVSNRSSVFVELDFSPEVRSTEGELNQNSISALLLIGLIAVAFFKQDLAMELLSFLWQRVNSIIANILAKNTTRKANNNRQYDATFDENEIDKLAQSINATKKKTVRKT